MPKYNVLDLFCGAGGMSLGFRMAGFNIYGGVDFFKDAMKTHQRNFDCKFSYCGDIKNISDKTIITKLKNRIDVIIGGPPCQGFSSANRWSKEKQDPRNRLFFEYLRFVEIIEPAVFVIENVKEILTKEKGYAKNRILEITKALGYNVNYKILNAYDYGVPELRKRAIFVGVRKDLKTTFDFNSMKKGKHYTVYDAIADLCDNGKNVSNNYLKIMKDSNKIYNNEKTIHNKKVVERIKYVPQGGNWKDVPKHLWDTERNNRHSSAYKRLSFKEPSITIDTGHMNYFHPTENRIPTVRESARLQSFPDSFVFEGNKSNQYIQVGNAVAPLFAKAIAEAILKLLRSKKYER